jgi:hypothetical protein
MTYSEKHHSGFFMVAEEAMRKIASSFEEPWATRAAMLAYFTLMRKANLRGSTSFEDRLASMAKDMALPYREAQRAIGLLESIGLVDVERRAIDGTHAKLPSIYSVRTLLPDAATSMPDAMTLCPHAITSMPDAGTLGGDGLREQSPHLFQELSQELLQEPHKEPSSASDDAFNRFWNAYPLKVGKKPAKQAWKKIKPLPDIEVILRSLEESKEKLWKDERFIPHPSTWLNKERWNDEIPNHRINGSTNNMDAAERDKAKTGLDYEVDWAGLDIIAKIKREHELNGTKPEEDDIPF